MILWRILQHLLPLSQLILKTEFIRNKELEFPYTTLDRYELKPKYSDDCCRKLIE